MASYYSRITYIKCEECDGRGYIEQQVLPIYPDITENVLCKKCKGVGWLKVVDVVDYSNPFEPKVKKFP